MTAPLIAGVTAPSPLPEVALPDNAAPKSPVLRPDARQLDELLSELSAALPGLQALGELPGSCGPACVLTGQWLSLQGVHSQLVHVLGYPLQAPGVNNEAVSPEVDPFTEDLLDAGSGHYLLAVRGTRVWIVDPSFAQFQRSWSAPLPGWPLRYAARELGLLGGRDLPWAACWDDTDAGCASVRELTGRWRTGAPDFGDYAYRPGPEVMARARQLTRALAGESTPAGPEASAATTNTARRRPAGRKEGEA